MKLELGRKRMLFKKWEFRKAEIVKIYKAKGKKYRPTLAKLAAIPSGVRDHLMNRFYLRAKKTYLDSLTEWLAKKNAMDKVWEDIKIVGENESNFIHTENDC